MNVLRFPLNDQIELREIMSRDASNYLPTLASDKHYVNTVRELDALLPPHSPSLHGVLWQGNADTLAPRLAECFGLYRYKTAGMTPLSKVFKAIRSEGPAAEAVRTLLTGKGDCAPALLLRRVIETRRGAALPTIDISNDGSPSPEIAAVIAAERKHVESERGTDSEALLRDRERKRKRRAKLKQDKGRKTRKARKHDDELSERVGYVESVRRGER